MIGLTSLRRDMSSQINEVNCKMLVWCESLLAIDCILKCVCKTNTYQARRMQGGRGGLCPPNFWQIS